ncbi:hypothetical protein D3C86_1900590 [compost metagenome]
MDDVVNIDKRIALPIGQADLADLITFRKVCCQVLQTFIAVVFIFIQRNKPYSLINCDL